MHSTNIVMLYCPRQSPAMSTGGETTESVKLESCDEFDSYSGTPWAGPSAMPANSNVKPLDNAEKGTKWGRDRLPHPQIEYRLSLWSILKKCCGKVTTQRFNNCLSLDNFLAIGSIIHYVSISTGVISTSYACGN